MRELTVEEVEKVNGGILPLLAAVAMYEVSSSVAVFCMGAAAAGGALIGYYMNSEK